MDSLWESRPELSSGIFGVSRSGESSLPDLDPFINEHDWNLLTNRIQDFSILANQTALNFFLDWLARAIDCFSGGDLLVHKLDQLLVGDGHILVGFGAAKYF